MKLLLLITLTMIFTAVQAEELPEEVVRFLMERKTCEHFLGEPVEGRTPEERERRNFVADSIDIYCAGTDKRLAALKRRYVENKSAMAVLRQFEEKLE